MTAVVFRGLRGRNPLGYLAALGTLALLDDAGVAGELSWTDDIAPTAIVHSPLADGAVAPVLFERIQRLRTGRLIDGPVGRGFRDVKLADNATEHSQFRLWLTDLREAGTALERRILGGLLAEGALDGKGDGKPTHLHFAAGQQQFLDIVREVMDAVLADPARLDEALHGPWRYDCEAKNLSWSAGSERIYAVRGFKPSGEKRLGVPGADALAFVGLSFFPVATRGSALLTTGCEPTWKTSSLTWPLWSEPVGVDVARSLIGCRLTSGRVSRTGVSEVLRSPIRRTDQGGYGSFGAASAVSL